MQRLAAAWRRAGVRVGLVPTMGYLHEGHLSLIRRARKWATPRGKVVVSIYVNPTQFGPTEDLAKYPRDLRRDLLLCRGAGADAVFAPSDEEMYPGRAEGRFSTYVVEERLSSVLEGKSRPTHFRGVTTIVAKLLNIVQPGLAVFGAKDWQQATVVKRMVADLNFPLQVVVGPTIREADGLALSSRNKYLTGELRPQAPVLWLAIERARARVAKAPRAVPAETLSRDLKRFIERQPAARVDYIQFFHPETLVPSRQVQPGTHLALAVFIASTRLIDNARM